MKIKSQVTDSFGRWASGLVMFALAHQMASAEVIVQEVTISRDSLKLPGVIFYDDSITTQRPAVVMLHGCSGMWRNGIPHEADSVTQQPRVEQYLDKWGRRLAEAGYIAVAVDSYTARKPPDRTESAWQNQCGWEYDQGVSENTVRPGDAEAARAWLAARSDIKTDKIGLMGWSQGATAAMVAMGATPIDSKTLRTEASTKPFKGAVAFYPGCGFKYGKNTWAFNGTSYSYWRPYAPVRINHGSHDKLYDAAYVKETDTFDLNPPPDIRHYCGIRVDRAKTVYGAGTANGNEVTLAVMPDAHHSFDYPHQTGFPAEPCPEPGHPADARAECVYDLESLGFLEALLK